MSKKKEKKEKEQKKQRPAENAGSGMTEIEKTVSPDDPDLLPAGADEEPEDGDEGELMTEVISASDSGEENIATLMAVAVDYALKRGKLKKSIRKCCKKIIRQYDLDVGDKNGILKRTEDWRKDYLLALIRSYGESASFAPEYAFCGAVCAAYDAKSEDAEVDGLKGDALWVRHAANVEQIKTRASALLGEAWADAEAILGKYREKLSLETNWDNIDEYMKRKYLKGLWGLAVRLAIREMKQKGIQK